jgi:PAS domain S-box-containing protein
MHRSQGTILIIDDEPQSLKLLTEILSLAGYDVRAAESGELALACAANVHPELILVDMQMPGMDGLEVCRRLKADGPTRETPIMFISGSSDRKKRLQGLELGAVDFVTKPFDRAELLARVRTHLELARLRSHLEREVSSRTVDLRIAVEQLQHEVAERKRSEQALRESEQRFRNMADAAPAMIVVSDPDRGATFFNKGWLDFTGRAMEQELGHGWAAGVHPEDRQHCLETISSSYQSQREFYVEYRLRRADGEYRWLISRAKPRSEPDGGFADYVGSAIDITELKRAQEGAVAAQKLESLGLLAGGVAHDFNNLLSGILAHSEILLEDLHKDSPIRESAEQIQAVARRAAEIVRELMVYAGQGDALFEEVDLAGLVREMIQLLKVSISKNATLKVELPRKVRPIHANAPQIRQVVMNLITNASDALAGKEGTVTIRLEEIRVARNTPGKMALELPEDDYLQLSVSDTGCGMTDQVRVRIFEPFYTTKAFGHGLGLAAVQGIIRSHAGAINVHSTPGLGSRFEILLPCAKDNAAAASGSADSRLVSEPGGPTGTVLLIDDEDALRLAVARMLRKQGFSTLEASDGQAGVDLFRAHAEEIDVVLLDVTMPKVSGRDVFSEILKTRPEAKIVLTTAFTRERALAEVGAEQSCLYIRKPFPFSELSELLRQVCLSK